MGGRASRALLALSITYDRQEAFKREETAVSKGGKGRSRTAKQATAGMIPGATGRTSIQEIFIPTLWGVQ